MRLLADGAAFDKRRVVRWWPACLWCIACTVSSNAPTDLALSCPPSVELSGQIPIPVTLSVCLTARRNPEVVCFAVDVSEHSCTVRPVGIASADCEPDSIVVVSITDIDGASPADISSVEYSARNRMGQVVAAGEATPTAAQRSESCMVYEVYMSRES